MSLSYRDLGHVFIQETTGVERINHPVSGAFVFPQGARYFSADNMAFPDYFKENRWLILVNENEPDPSACEVLASPAAYWPDGSVKWLHLHGNIDLKPSALNKFTLRTGSHGTLNPIVCQSSPGQITVNTRRIRVTLNASGEAILQAGLNPGPLEELPAFTPLLTGPGLSASLTLDGSSPLAWTPNADSLSIASQTENRVVLRITGFFTHENRHVAEMILFLEILQDTPEIRLQPVLIYLGDPDKDVITDHSLTVHTALGHADGRFALAQERGMGHWDTTQPVGPNDDRALAQAARPQKPENFTPNAGGPRFPEARILQTGSSFYKLEKRTTPSNSWVKIAEGKRNPGWVHLAHPGHDAIAGVTAAMRYFWQEYPRSLSLNADTGQITFGLVPPDAEPLHFKRYSDFKWGAAMYETGRGPFPAQTHGATGIAKASELLLHFHTSSTRDPGPATRDTSPSPARVGLHWANPVTLLPPPEQIAGSHVFGAIAAAPAKGFEPLETELARLLDFIIAEREYRNWYGLMNFGDVMMSYYADKDQWAYDDGGYAWLNTEALPDHALWMSALRSGRHDWLRAAVEMTRHNRDVDIYHRGNFKGTGSRHNVQHWGDADKEWRISMPITQRLHYYLTADPWTRESILDTIAVYQSYDRASRLAPSMSSALMGLMVKHELTGSAADGQAVRNMLDLYASAVGDDGHYANQLHVNIATGQGRIVPDGKNLVGAYFFLLNFGAQHTLVMAQEAYGHEELAKSFVRYSHMCLSYVRPPHVEGYQAPLPYASTAFFASALRSTGDAKFADAMRKHLHIADELILKEIGGDDPLDTPRHLALVNCRRRNKVVCHLGEIMNLYPYAFKALET